MTSETHDETALSRLWQSVSKLLVWIGASAGTLTLVLSTCGYLVEHAYLDRLGIPRTFYEAQPAEYVTAGGKFFMGIIPLAAAGAPQFVIRYWWLALAILAVGASAWRWRWREEWRWLSAAALLGMWLVVALPRFESDLPTHDANALVAILTTVVVAGILYCYVELAMRQPRPDVAATSRRRAYAARLPFVVLLISAALALPYLRGAHAMTRRHPDIEFLGKDRAYFCELAGASDEAACGHDLSQLIEVGRDRAILRRSADTQIYVVPAGTLNTFRIVQRGGE